MRVYTRLFAALLVTFLFYASNIDAAPIGTTGKIIGIVTDAGDGLPITGAVIHVLGTTLAAQTDDDGQYVILNIPVGEYDVVCKFMGYDSAITRNIKISIDETVKLDFKMKLLGKDIGIVIEVEGERLETIHSTNSGITIGQKDLEQSPLREYIEVIGRKTGVVIDENAEAIHFRGSREGEVVTVVDGVRTNNPLDRNSTQNISANLIYEISALTGGFSAEYGNALGGYVNITTKSPKEKYTGSLELVSDFASGDWMDTKSQGYNIYSISLGGPVIPVSKLSKYWSIFGNYERTFKLVDLPVSTDIAKLWFDDGILKNFTREGHSWSAKTVLYINEMTRKPNNTGSNFDMRITAGYLGNTENSRMWLGSFGLYNSFSNPRVQTENHQFYGKLNQSFGAATYYDLQGSYLVSTYTRGDGKIPFDEEVTGSDGFGRPWYLRYYDTIPNSRNFGVFRDPNDINNLAQKRKTEQLSFNLNFVHQIVSEKFGLHEIKFGGEYMQYKLRYFDLSPANYSLLEQRYDTVNHRLLDPVITENAANSSFLLAYGYDPFGREIDNDYMWIDPTSSNSYNITEGPRKPRMGSFYILDKIEFPYFNTNIGLRVDYLDPNTEVPIDYRDLKGPDGIFNDADFKPVDKTIILSPRLGFSFPITASTSFRAQYGKFVQLPALQDLYTNRRILRDLADGGIGYFTVFNNPLLRPEKTTAYELGLVHSAGPLSFGLTAYYKETSDLIQARNIKAYDLSYSAAIYDNGDFGIVRGVDFSLDLRRTSRLRGSVAYSISFASGTGSDPTTLFNVAYNGDEPPKIPSALSYDQRHTGSIELDYRWGDSSDVPRNLLGSILQNVGINLLFSFNSGRPFTPVDKSSDPLAVVSGNGGSQPIAPMNSAYSPWNYRLDLKVDKTVKLFDKINVNMYLIALNVLDQTLINDVFDASGEPGSTGWLDSFQGKLWAQQNGPEAVRLYQIRSHALGNYGPPRQVRLGLRLYFN